MTLLALVVGLLIVGVLLAAVAGWAGVSVPHWMRGRWR